MVTDDQAPATKQDIRLLMEQMGDYYVRTERRISQLEADVKQWKVEIIHEFHVVAENLHRDFRDAFKDRTEQHEVRITLLEKRTGLIAA